jgi:very-short-patch-repair endonuclease
MTLLFNARSSVEVRTSLRMNSTDAEVILWEAIRGRRLVNAKFRRQHSIGPYITDFCSPGHRLIVELDGSVHNGHEQAEYDEQRDAYLRSLGFKVLRFSNHSVMDELDIVLHTIQSEILAKS